MEAFAQLPMDPQEFQNALREILADEAKNQNLELDPVALNVIASRGGINFTNRFGPGITDDFTARDLPRVRDVSARLLTELATQVIPSPDGTIKITANMVSDFFKGFCDRFPDFFPFCV
jgi:hypothetical protein